MLEKLKASLQAQTCKDFEQVIIHDRIGIGVPKANAQLASIDASGDFVLVLDDDNIVTDKTFVEKLRNTVLMMKPEVLVTPIQIDGRVLPQGYTYGNVDSANVIVSQNIWVRFRKFWQEKSASDWDYIKAILESSPNVIELDEVMLKAQRVSRGLPE